MKGLFYAAAFAILASTPVFGADAVSLVGTWAGQRERIAKVEGRRGGLATLVVTEQQGNTFVGRLKRSNASNAQIVQRLRVLSSSPGRDQICPQLASSERAASSGIN